MARKTMYQTGAKLARLSRVYGMDEEEDGYGLNYDQGPATYYTEEQRKASSNRYDEAIKTLRDIRINSTLASRLNEDVANPQPKIAQIGWGTELKDVKIAGANLPVSERLTEVQMTETEKRAQQLQNIAKDFASTDPKLSNEYFKQSLELRQKADQEKSNALNIQAEKLKQRADVAASVVDQQSLDEAIPMLKSLGVNVPKEMMVFNDKSQEFFKSRAMMSSSFQKQVQEQRMADDLKRKEEKDAADNKIKEQKLKQQDQRIQIARDALTNKINNPSNVKAAKEGKFDILAERQFLETSEDVFADLPDGTKTAIARSVGTLTYSLMQEQKMPEFEARALARQQILEQLDPKTGKLNLDLEPTKPKATKFVEGKVYVDKNGNKAKYSNGKWTPQ